MSAAFTGRPWADVEIANCFGVMREDAMLWHVFGGLPSHQNEWGETKFLDCDVQALARYPDQAWGADAHRSSPISWPSAGWVCSSVA